MPYFLIANVSDGSTTNQEFEPPIENRVRAGLALHLELGDDELAQVPPVLRVEVKSGWKKIPEVFGWSSGPYIICPALRAEIERLEPNTHKFRPIEIKTDKPLLGRIEHGTYFIILAPPRVDCVDIDHTQFSNGFGRSGYERSRSQVTRDIGFASHREAPCALFGDTIKGRHLWQLPEGWQNLLVISDELWAFYKNRKMKGWDIRKTCRIT